MTDESKLKFKNQREAAVRRVQNENGGPNAKILGMRQRYNAIWTAKGDMVMTDDLTERVAKAVWRATQYDHHHPTEEDWQNARGIYLPLVRSAIAAIEAGGYVVVPRESTGAMLAAGFRLLGWEDSHPEDIWHAMIDAALAGKCPTC